MFQMFHFFISNETTHGDPGYWDVSISRNPNFSDDWRISPDIIKAFKTISEFNFFAKESGVKSMSVMSDDIELRESDFEGYEWVEIYDN